MGAASLCFVSPFFVWLVSSAQAQHNVNDKFLFLEWDCMIENTVKSEKVLILENFGHSAKQTVPVASFS